jgi:hypothetical protein
VRFKAALRPQKTSPIESRVDRDAHANGWSARNQQFLSYFLSRYGQRRTIPLSSLCIAVVAGVGIGALVHQAASEAAITLRVALSVVSGVAGLAIVRRKLVACAARRRLRLRARVLFDKADEGGESGSV